MNLYDLILDDYYNPKLKKVKEIRDIKTILKTEDVVSICNNNFNMKNLMQENVYLFCLNSNQFITGVFLINKGSTDASTVSKREIFIALLLTGSSRFIIAHNHPNNNLNVSNSDINITNQLKFIATILDVEFVDHVIITKDGFTSMRSQNLM